MTAANDPSSEATRVALQLTIRGEIIDVSAVPDPGGSFSIEELAQGFDPRRISFYLDNLTTSSPRVWLAAVGNTDCKLEVALTGCSRDGETTFQATIVGHTIVPLRSLFDSAKIAMTSGCSVNLVLQEGSGPIRVFRQVRRFRRILQ